MLPKSNAADKNLLFSPAEGEDTATTHQKHSKSRSKSASGSVGSRILSAFRSTAHIKDDSQVQVKSLSPTQSSAATFPAGRRHSEVGGKTSVANIFPSIATPRNSDTTQNGSPVILQQGGGTSTNEEHDTKLSDSGIGKSPAKQEKNDGNDGPANPEEVLKRLEEPTKPVNAVKLIAGEPPTTSPKALDRLIGIPNETPAKAVSTLTGVYDIPTRLSRCQLSQTY